MEKLMKKNKYLEENPKHAEEENMLITNDLQKKKKKVPKKNNNKLKTIASRRISLPTYFEKKSNYNPKTRMIFLRSFQFYQIKFQQRKKTYNVKESSNKKANFIIGTVKRGS